MNSPSGGETGTRAALARAAPLPQAEEALHEQAQQEPVPQPGRLEVPESFAAAVALVREQGEGILANHLMDDVHLVRYEPGRVELRVTDAAPANLASRFGAILEKACGGRWVITISQQQGDATLRQQARTDEAAKRAAIMQHPLVQAIIETFPEARLVARRDPKMPRPLGAPNLGDADAKPDANTDEGADER